MGSDFRERSQFELTYSKDEVVVKRKPWKTTSLRPFVGDIRFHNEKISMRIVADTTGEAVDMARDTLKGMQAILDSFYKETT